MIDMANPTHSAIAADYKMAGISGRSAAAPV